MQDIIERICHATTEGLRSRRQTRRGGVPVLARGIRVDFHTGAELLVDELIRPLEDGVGGIADLGRFFATFKRKFAGPEVVHGCLMVNTATEIGGRDPDIAARVEAYFDSLERALLACLSRARELGEFEASNADLRSRARILRAGVEGILVELRLGRNSQEVGRTIRAMRASVPGLGARTRSAG